MTGRGLAAFTVLMLAHAAPAGAEPGFAPGAWAHTVEMLSADVPGVPEFMIRMFAGNRNRASCLTPDQALRAPQTLLTQDDNAKCRTTRFAMQSGRFDYVAICTNKRFPEGLSVASTGGYTPVSYTIRSIATGQRKGRPVKIVTQGAGKRTAASCR